MIEFKNVSKSFNGVPVLRGLTFTAGDSRVTGFVGPNGSGKSTALKVLSGILRADSGEAMCDGSLFGRGPQNAMGTFLGAETLPNGMTGSGYLAYVCALRNAPRSDGTRYLQEVGLNGAAKTQIRDYSLGMRQRIGLAAALVGEPRNLVLDEPVNGLDVEGVRWLREFLRGVASGGRSVLLSSHLLSELELVADDIVILSDGRIVKSGGLQELKRTPLLELLIVTPQRDALQQMLSKKGFQFDPRREGIAVRDVAFRELAQLVLDGNIEVDSISKVERRIEDLYFEETGHARGKVVGNSVGGVR